jgi:hypothetical protein
MSRPIPKAAVVAAGETKMQHGVIPNTEACLQIRCVEDCTHLVHREVAHECLIVAPDRDGMDLSDLFQSFSDRDRRSSFQTTTVSPWRGISLKPKLDQHITA